LFEFLTLSGGDCSKFFFKGTFRKCFLVFLFFDTLYSEQHCTYENTKSTVLLFFSHISRFCHRLSHIFLLHKWPNWGWIFQFVGTLSHWQICGTGHYEMTSVKWALSVSFESCTDFFEIRFFLRKFEKLWKSTEGTR
jgi:hypothetical protein